jgi:hypothetical protein
METALTRQEQQLLIAQVASIRRQVETVATLLSNREGRTSRLAEVAREAEDSVRRLEKELNRSIEARFRVA